MNAEDRPPTEAQFQGVASMNRRSKPISGVQFIAEERRRQVERKGYDVVHDREHQGGELALAAVAYALPVSCTDRADWWPWAPESFKPSPDDRMRELVKAGALIAAEIDRLRAGGAA